MSLYFLTLGQPVLTGESGDEFGAALASNADIDGDGLFELVVGAPGASKIHVYTTNGSGLDTTATQSLDGEANTDRLGAVLVLHDLDGDGYADLVAGAPARESDAGAVYVYAGTSDGLDDAPTRRDGTAPGDALGTSLAVGDLDGSGESDILVGAPYADGTGTDSGAAYVFLDGATTATTTWVGTYDDDRFGAAVAVVPDIDSDGDDEAAVGAPFGGLTGRALGWAYLFTEHDAAAAAWEMYGGGTDDNLGRALLGGDFNGDGSGDLLVGSNGYSSESAVQLFASSGGALGMVTDGTVDYADGSLALGPAGDIDSDGDDDFFVVYSYTTSDCADTVELAAVVGGDPAGLGGSFASTESGPLAMATLGDIYGSGQPALALSADDGVLVHAGESDGDGVPPGMTIDWADCDDNDATRDPLAHETDGDGVDNDCDGNDDIVARAAEACPDLEGDPALVLAWAEGIESGDYVDNAATVLAVLEEAYTLGCADLAPADATSVSDARAALANCDDPGIAGFSQLLVESWLAFSEEDFDCLVDSSRERTRAVSMERDSGDTAEPAAIDGWVREEDSTTESGGWVRWQDGTVEPIRAATYEYEYEYSNERWSYEYYTGTLALADGDATVTREYDRYTDTWIETITVTTNAGTWVYADAYSQPIDCGYPESWGAGTRVTTPTGSTWYTNNSLTTAYPDADADGWPVEYGDCDDANPSRYPCAEEDGIDDVDDDCNGSLDLDLDGDGLGAEVDCDDTDASVGRPTEAFSDNDDDGYGGAVIEYCPGDTRVADVGGDCDDDNAEVHPGAPEVCNGIDDDCGGNVDDYAIDAPTVYADGDDDGYGGHTERTGCPEKEGYSVLTGDCDDTNPTINPGAEEITANAVDEDCDGTAQPCEPGAPCDHSDTRGCFGSFAVLLLPLAALPRRHGQARRRPPPGSSPRK